MLFTQLRTCIAWAYYRFSAEDKQENSILIQNDQAHLFANRHNIKITLEIEDEGKSGVSANRPGFERLFRDYVLNPDISKPDYILVYDVSRWGRFQDPDEAAYWTMLCKQQGIQVVYVDDGFPQENQMLTASLQTQIKRFAAADYSRTLSTKVFNGSAKVTEQGYSAGGAASYGLTRVLLNENKEFERVLKPGEHKVIANQRVTFAPANDEKTITVKRIFDELTINQRHPKTIAHLLNGMDTLTAISKQWDASRVIKVLSNERYAGTLIYNKTWKRLKQPQRRNPTSEWIRRENAFEGIVTKEQFEHAQEQLYWLLPSRHRYGVRRIRAAEHQFKEFLQENITKKLHDDDSFKLLHEFPVSFGLTFYRKEQAKQCFRITESRRRCKEVLCLGLDMFNKDKVDVIYRLPMEQFGIGDYVIINENDPKFSVMKIDATNAASTVIEMSKELLAS